MRINRKDVATGIIFMAVGLFYLVYALNTLSMGRALNMGPGYFPIVLSSILMIVGLIVIGRSFIVLETTPFGVVPWRAIVMLTVSIVFFALFLQQLGLFPAVLLASALACLASRRIKPVSALITGLCISCFCWLVFKAFVGLPIATFGTWFDGTPLTLVEPALLSSVHFLLGLPKALVRLIGIGGR